MVWKRKTIRWVAVVWVKMPCWWQLLIDRQQELRNRCGSGTGFSLAPPVSSRLRPLQNGVYFSYSAPGYLLASKLHLRIQVVWSVSEVWAGVNDIGDISYGCKRVDWEQLNVCQAWIVSLGRSPSNLKWKNWIHFFISWIGLCSVTGKRDVLVVVAVDDIYYTFRVYLLWFYFPFWIPAPVCLCQQPSAFGGLLLVICNQSHRAEGRKQPRVVAADVAGEIWVQ